MPHKIARLPHSVEKAWGTVSPRATNTASKTQRGARCRKAWAPHLLLYIRRLCGPGKQSGGAALKGLPENASPLVACTMTLRTQTSVCGASGYDCQANELRDGRRGGMGVFLNPGAGMLRRGRNSNPYVDKSMLIAHLNSVVNTEHLYVCVSRPRRFGKSMAANMVSAYYDRTVDGAAEFAGLAIACDPSFDRQRNSYDVLKLNMQEFWTKSKHNVVAMVADLQDAILFDLLDEYADLRFRNTSDMVEVLSSVYAQTGRQFVIVIDEWDCIMRESAEDHDAQKAYLDFLRAWLKDQPFVALAYMTGILPVKKYGSHSALNMFDEFSMVDPLEMAPYMGFTSDEVAALCQEWGRDLNECKAWYDGYHLPGAGEVYAPRSVVRAMMSGEFSSYWTQTETFEALRKYIDMDLDGLHDKVVELVGGGRVEVNTQTYSNDMTTLNSADDVLTLLIHLGYLAYDKGTREAFVPNREVAGEYANATQDKGWSEVARSIAASEQLLRALLAGDTEAVAAGVEQAHSDVASIIAYNHEEDLACTLRLAFYSAMRRYRLVREAPAGKGYADLLMVPLKSSGDIPGVVVELKWGASAQDAIAQMRERDYAAAFRGTSAEHRTILCGIAYDPKTKRHTCAIEQA